MAWTYLVLGGLLEIVWTIGLIVADTLGLKRAPM